MCDKMGGQDERGRERERERGEGIGGGGVAVMSAVKDSMQQCSLSDHQSSRYFLSYHIKCC